MDHATIGVVRRNGFAEVLYGLSRRGVERIESGKSIVKEDDQGHATELDSEGGEKAQQARHDIIDRQINVNAEVADSFFEVIQQLQSGRGLTGVHQTSSTARNEARTQQWKKV